jgi:hypothetical protein
MLHMRNNYRIAPQDDAREKILSEKYFQLFKEEPMRLAREKKRKTWYSANFLYSPDRQVRCEMLRCLLF